MSTLEKSMENLITVFHKYAHKGQQGKFLKKEDLKILIERELPDFMKAQKNPDAVDKIMKELDQDKDAKLSFEEFVPLIVGISVSCEKWCAINETLSKQ